MIKRRVNTELSGELREHRRRIEAQARAYGLDFFDVVFEVLDFRTMNQIAAYGGFPTRYPHWRWGMEFDSLSKRDAYGLGRIYEMVINNDPVYAYLQESNDVVDQKLVMAHVFGHADFFRHNFWFGATDRKMINTMANHATRVQRHIERHGRAAVEQFLDACLSLEHLIDPYSVFRPGDRVSELAGERPGDEGKGPGGRGGPVGGSAGGGGVGGGGNGAGRTGDSAAFSPTRLPAKDYMDPFVNPRKALEKERAEFETRRKAQRGRVPAKPTRDVLLFLLLSAPLEDWQQDLLSIVRDESYYFAPQAMTKVMNEGWATYWHSKLMTEHFVEAREIVHYADQHSGVVHMPPGGFNPYKIGLALFKDIERRWDAGQHGPEWERLETLGARERHDDRSMKGREKIFEVRRIYNDVNFIDEFLTERFVEEHRMYRTRRDPQTGEVRVVSRDWKQVKQELLARLSNMGQPFMYVVDGNYLNRGELYLAHQWNGLDLDLAKAGEVMRNLRLIWGRPVHVQARCDDQMFLLTCADAGEAVKREKIGEETPKPAHVME
ncbi:MAG: SpoVR family protein [Phycisphaerales bacterium]|nr:SpoVR family protein [Phycisphaerales bacterium]